MKNILRVHYDEEADFLEISLGNTSPCVAEEIQPGVFLRKNNGIIQSIGILEFKKRSKDVELPVEMDLYA